MSRTLRIVLFGGVALAAWCFSSDVLLSRVTSDDVAADDASAQAPADGQGESDYQVVKLLSKLFTSIKRNHVEVLNLHRQYARTTEPGERADLRKQMTERIDFVEGKAREYAQLAPSLQQSYPGLKSVIKSFTRDLKSINGDLDLIKQTDGVGADTVASAGGKRKKSDPRGAERTTEAQPPQEGMLTKALEHEREENGGGELTQRPDAAPKSDAAPGGIETTALGPVVPITLEVRGAGGGNVNKRKIVFQVADNKRTGMRGFLDGGNIIKEAVAYTDDAGRAVVKLQLENTERPLKIKRTIMPRDDHTVCLLETVE
jgi:hypothetical protein